MTVPPPPRLPRLALVACTWVLAWACGPAGAPAGPGSLDAAAGAADAAVSDQAGADSAAQQDPAPLADAATAIGPDAVPDAAGADTAAAAGADTTAADAPTAEVAIAAAATPAAPYLATGKLTEVSDLLEGPWPINPGDKAKSEPPSSGTAIEDLDGDGLLDIVAHDAVGEVRLYRSLAGQPWKWNKEVVLPGYPDPRTVALYAEPDGPPVVLTAGARVAYSAYDKKKGAWIESGVARGLQVPINVAVQTAAPHDVDEDGLLDIVATIFTCNDASKPLVFVAQGNGNFAEQGVQLGLGYTGSLWNTLHTDVDGDGHPDLLAMSETCPPQNGNAYFHNRGHPSQGLRYEQQKLPPIFNAPSPMGGSPMGAAVADFDGNGQLDLFLTMIGLRDARLGGTDLGKLSPALLQKFAGDCNQLLLRQPDGKLVNTAPQAGLTAALSSTGLSMVAWTALPVDLDVDGHLDLLVTHAYDFAAFLLSDEGAAHPVFYRNLGNGKFADLSQQIGLPAPHIGRHAALADLDNDGDLDLFLGGQAAAPRLYRNDVATGGHHLSVRLHGTASNPFGLGARLQLKTTARTLVAEATIHAAPHGMAGPLVHFAWPAGEEPQSLTVIWPTGYSQKLVAGNWPIDGKPLDVAEPALFTLSSRWLPATANATSVVKARTFDPYGKPLAAPQASIELAPGDAGTFTGPTVCDNVECTRTYQPPVGVTGEAALVVTVAGKPWAVRPRVRYVAQGKP
ncbi:MAG: VCBS repeat-containing protein [Deltaproteobacteria bacterium]|nr:VCBS repeat-containing protein [Deltaproteobacteria bacterium]